MTPIYFKTSEDLRKWFQKNYLNEKEVFVAFYNKASGKKSITWYEAVGEALCFGWIDSVARKIDIDSHCNRFSPRRLKSNWSDVNIKRIEDLIEKGLVTEEGKQIFYNRDLTKQKSASFEQEKVEFSVEFLKIFRTNKIAWHFFEAQTNSYKKQATWHVISAKQAETQLRRLDILINDSENHIHIKQLRRTPQKMK